MDWEYTKEYHYGHEYKRERGVVTSWINNKEKFHFNVKPFLYREGDTLFMGYRPSPNGDGAVAIKIPNEIPDRLFFNTDIWGVHQNYTMRAGLVCDMLKNYCENSDCKIYRIPFSILKAAKFDIRRLRVLDHNKRNIFPYDEFTLLEDIGLRLLIGEDNRLDFGELVGKQCATVVDALNFLKPNEVKEAEALGTPVIRQGDWFFVRAENLEDILQKEWEQTKLYPEKRMKGYPLPAKKGGNVHIAHEGCEYKGKIYVTGTIRHHLPVHKRGGYTFVGLSAGTHGMLKLEGPWQALHNNSTKSFSQQPFFEGWGRGSD